MSSTRTGGKSFGLRHRFLTHAMMGIALAIATAQPTWAEDAGKEKLKEALREKLEKLPPAERQKAIKRFEERAKQIRDAAPKAQLPADLASIQPVSIKGQSLLPLETRSESAKVMTVGELNRLYASQAGQTKPVKDDVFVRRIYLDTLGHLPAPADIEEYLADKSANRKAKLIAKLLALPQFGQHWGKYWSDVVRYRASNEKFAKVASNFEIDWLAKQFNENKPWSEIVSDIVTAEGEVLEHPQGFFIACHDADPMELAGEATRIFLGTQISCANCHDHPYDPWKRDQFHGMAAFFGKTGFRLKRKEPSAAGFPFTVEVGEKPLPGLQYRMPDLHDPSKPGAVIQPLFLTGQPLPLEADDAQRREALAAFLVNEENPTFAKAFVNRMWYELVGFGFVEPIDDLGPSKQPQLPELFDALSSSFVASGYDVKHLFKLILLSSVYDRQMAEPASDSAPARRSMRLSADEIFTNLDWVLGNIDDGQSGGFRNRGARGKFEEVFGVDPSTPAEDVAGSVPQALALMNFAGIENRIKASQKGSLLNKLLSTNHKDADVIDMLYMRVLGRKPTRQEVNMCLAHVRSVDVPAEGYEDILWSLINSSEFLYQH